MPLYDYRCNGCGRTFEVQQPMNDPDLVKCEVCGEDKLEKLISWIAFGNSDQLLYKEKPKEELKWGRHRKPKEEKPAPTAEPAAAASAAPTTPDDKKSDA